MHSHESTKAFNAPELNAAIRPLRQLDNTTNFFYLALDYLTLAAVVGAAMGFYWLREGWGLSWYWNIPVTLIAITLAGAIQHRFAGMGHEAAHYTMFKNRVLNDVVSDLFCMFPIFATTHQYRLVHMGHHQFTNDWERDPDLLNIGKSKLMHCFPMSRIRFIYNYYVRFFLPHVLLRYLWDIVYLSAFGGGISPYQKATGKDEANRVNMNFRWTSVLGVLYFFGLAFGMAYANSIGNGALLVSIPTIGATVMCLGIAALPESAFFQSPLRASYPIKVQNILRIVYYTLLLASFGFSRYLTGINFGKYFLLLWALPLLTSFAYFMLLRDVYQHANADDGKLTNSRVFFTDPFTRWAVFVYGQDIHIPHHMFPAIPHYNLLAAHRILQQHSEPYRSTAVECHGTFHNADGAPTILDVMHTPLEPPAEKRDASRPLAASV